MKRFPMAHKVDTSHPYTRSEATDIRKTFARAKRQQAAAPAPTPAPTSPPAAEPVPSPVVSLFRKAQP